MPLKNSDEEQGFVEHEFATLDLASLVLEIAFRQALFAIIRPTRP